MDFFRNRYYNANRLLLSFAGLWPYQDVYKRVTIVAVLFLFLCVSMFMMILKMVKTSKTLVFVTYWLQFAVPAVLFVIDLVYFFIRADKMRTMLEHIKCDWSLFQQCDTEVIEPYAEIARKVTLGLAALSVVCLSLLLLPGKLSDSNDTDILELFIPVDVSNISHRDYIVYSIFVECLGCFLGLVIALAVGTLYLCSIQHACGIFSIVGKRMETMFDGIEDTYVSKSKVNLHVFQSIMFHTRAIGFMNIVNSFYGPLYLTKMSLLIVMLSIDILQVADTYNNAQNSGKTCISFGHLLAVLLTITIFCYSGQLLIDHSNDIFRKIYSSQWYVAPLNVQKLVVTVMIRSLRESGITMTKSITASFEMLATMLQLAVSYFMAISSLQNK